MFSMLKIKKICNSQYNTYGIIISPLVYESNIQLQLPLYICKLNLKYRELRDFSKKEEIDKNREMKSNEKRKIYRIKEKNRKHFFNAYFG